MGSPRGTHPPDHLYSPLQAHWIGFPRRQVLAPIPLHRDDFNVHAPLQGFSWHFSSKEEGRCSLR